MTSSSSLALERGLDTMILVYSLVKGHPAAVACQHFLATKTGWFTSPLVLFEAKNILTRVYSVDPADATHKLTQFASGPIVLLDIDPTDAVPVLHLADAHGLDLTDAVLLHLACRHGAGNLATEDRHFAQTAAQHGVVAESPFDAVVRNQVASWEALNLAPKGLARVLRRVYQLLSPVHPQAAHDFWSQTGAGSHLP